MRLSTKALTKPQSRGRVQRLGLEVLENTARVLFNHAQQIVNELRFVEDTVPLTAGQLANPRIHYKRTGRISAGWRTDPAFFDFDIVAARNPSRQASLIVRIYNDVTDNAGGVAHFTSPKTKFWKEQYEADFLGEKYAEFVMGNKQRGIHKGRWPLAAEIQQRLAPTLQGRINSAIRQAQREA